MPHVKSLEILYKVLRPCLFRPVVQFADVSANDDIVALASDTMTTYHVTFYWQIDGNCV